MAALCSQCFFGGLVIKGGHAYAPTWESQASLLNGRSYQIVCLKQDSKTDVEHINAKTDPKRQKHFNLLPPERYGGGCEIRSQSSVFYLFNMWPLTAPLDPDYLLSRAVQQREADSLIQLRIWHEVHYYGLIGRVFVMHLEANAIRFTDTLK